MAFLRGPEKTVRDVATGQERATLAGHQSLVTSLAFSPDSRLLASGGFDRTIKRTIKLWDLARIRSQQAGYCFTPAPNLLTPARPLLDIDIDSQ